MYGALSLLSLYLLSTLAPVGAQELTQGQVDLIGQRLAESGERSWELGVRTQAALELNATRMSVFSPAGVPPPRRVPEDLKDPLEPVWNIVRRVISERGPGDDPRPLVQDGSTADPASIGVAVVLANITDLDGTANEYADAARGQLRFLFSDQVPKTDEGAISHRGEQLQIWSDSVYMVPPFLAYYGVATDNKTIVEEAFNQVKLYRKLLRDEDTGLWKHSVLGNNSDPGLWATGNGWAAAGMLRVYATIKHSKFGDDMDDELDDLEDWVQEIHEGVYRHYFDSESLVHNYLNDNRTFYDASATALLAATVYRASVLLDEHDYIPYAERTRMTLFTPHGGVGANTNRSAFEDYEFFTTDGWLRPVVNPVSIREVLDNGRSSEAQAFVVMMHAAWEDWRAQGEEGKATGAAVALSARGLGLLVPAIFAVVSAFF
ncbi:hypothetical protein CC1G_02670 [Coprinopsis cinerea okayama7|uniref:Six-hairpin glycosidase n=1 Tax=Coprinopsis cinerea (strain Okayama-7 / 130 / ATCC MYA-4618 / FGSC 9003) TaxID=240176 RepID=A8PBK7_COPC7|nr:hypothetical protein CC1G_02670 [Coprinopsis cinerea okayama7\|eukprot:XP_001840207.1 hypothetical protein CC1G_02670 [Coprinopsis cinerea okayama7\